MKLLIIVLMDFYLKYKQYINKLIWMKFNWLKKSLFDNYMKYVMYILLYFSQNAILYFFPLHSI